MVITMKEKLTDRLPVIYQEMVELGLIKDNPEVPNAYRLSRRLADLFYPKPIEEIDMFDIISAVEKFNINDIEAVAEYSAVIATVIDIIKERRSERYK